MAAVIVKPARFDVVIADRIAESTAPLPEHIAGALTWGADAHVLGALAFGCWILSRTGAPPARRAGNHLLLCTIASAALPHLFKKFIDQDRPDRLTLMGHLHGVPFSGHRRDAFPSGHALHIGALGSAASGLPPRPRNIVWGLGATLILTRIVLLAHWTSDVAAGLGMGVSLERLLRRVTGFHPRDIAELFATLAARVRPSR